MSQLKPVDNESADEVLVTMKRLAQLRKKFKSSAIHRKGPDLTIWKLQVQLSEPEGGMH